MDRAHAGFLPAARAGKLGLALSGGGFRAALFHIGVLARLAELDLLREVAVISTVSGGSIIGAYYYLKVKELLEGRRPDGLTPGREAYIQLIREVETGFLAGVQKNMRMRTFANRRQNARMLRQRYSPTERLAELYTQHFFASLWESGKPIRLRDLPIRPSPALARFPTVPLLIINATTLNHGHLWQFTGAHVGEAGGQYEWDHGLGPPLAKRYFDDPALSAPQRHRLDAITLGQAVSASCCVPGIFEPLSLTGLYETEQGEPIEVRLVDGGVYDNQGLVSLFGEGCTHLICSDASDPLKKQPTPNIGLLSVAMRANEIMMDRIRAKTLNDLFERYRERCAFFHLGDEVGEAVFPYAAQPLVKALTYIRTDLDSFTDLEAYTLMYYGYWLSGGRLAEQDEALPPPASAPPAEWDFLAVWDLLVDEQRRGELLKHLGVGANPFFKVFYLKKPLPYAIVFTALLFPVGVTLFLFSLLPPLPPWVWGALGVVALSLVAYSQNARIIQLLDRIPPFRRSRRRLARALTPLGVPMLLGLLGAVITWVHLNVFDRLFLWYGAVDRRRLPVRKKRAG